MNKSIPGFLMPAGKTGSVSELKMMKYLKKYYDFFEKY